MNDLVLNDPLNHCLDFLIQHDDAEGTPIFLRLVLDFPEVLERNAAIYHEGYLNGYSASWRGVQPDPEFDPPEYIAGFDHGRANAMDAEVDREIQRDYEMLEEWGTL